jgi:transposase
MLAMPRKNSIRESYFVNGKTISEISRETGHDRKTIRQVIYDDDWNQPPPTTKGAETPKLDPFKATIDEWLTEDKRSKRIQRHTSTRVYDRLRTEDGTKETFDCSYETVNTYVQKRKKELYGTQNDGYLPLEHKPGEAQCDFGCADYYENGALIEGHHLNVSFPHSNQGYPQLFPGENTECLFEGLVNIFAHIGGVPPEIWFDNATTMVKEIRSGGERGLTDRFIRFKEHYGFTALFCNPDSGNEKGSVEGKVGYHRRNMLVPVPRFKELGEYNKQLLELADADGAREHYRAGVPIRELHEKDKSALLPLPRNEFDTAGYIIARADKYGIIRLNDGKHEYSTSPKYAGGTVTAKLTSTAVTILDETGRPVVSHKRLYGAEKQRGMNWVPYLELLARRPRAVKYSGVYGMLPTEIREYLDANRPGDTSEIIRMIAEFTKRTGFESAVATVAQAAKRNVSDPDSLKALHRRMHMDIPELPPLSLRDAPRLDPLIPDLSKYDIAIDRGCAQ